MAEQKMPDGRVMDIKSKYTCSKSRGAYKGGGGQNTPRAKRKKTGGGPSPVEQVMVLTADGRIRWTRRPREQKR